MTYLVVAPLVIARDQAGHSHHVYEGGVIQWLSDEQAKHFLDEGLVRELDDADPDDARVLAGRPSKTATKPVLIDWLAGKGFDRDELEDQTKDQLWELIDATE